ncbi:MAG: ABC transporter ATP-binding protein, partial [Vicinamibacterales bacterium]
PPAVRQLDMAIRQGTLTALVGASGAGKSTVADLLLGLLTPTEGQILVDGQPLTPDRLKAWRSQVGYVPQDTFLVHDTVRANLLWARPEASESDLWQALHLAAADEFVAGLAEGLDTVIGDRGLLISGGERQRLAFARALLRKPRLLILDEATNALDAENQSRIQRAIERLRHTTTIVMITHRLSTVRSADMIHVMDAGRLVDSGAWTELEEQVLVR